MISQRLRVLCSRSGSQAISRVHLGATHNKRVVNISPPSSSSSSSSSSLPFGSLIRSFSVATTPPDSDNSKNERKSGIIDRIFGVESNIASDKFKGRWAMVAPAFLTHMCIGSPYAWSMMADAITREFGYVAPSFADWTLMQAVLPLSLVFAFHGLSASLLGKWQLKVGARMSMAAGALTFGGGMLVGALGINLHILEMVYFGYGVMGGIGLGLSYTPPIQTLMQWFPDRKGLASGLTIAGFGSGSLVFTPIIQELFKMYAKVPEYLGKVENYTTSIVDGRMFADVNGKLVEVVSANATDIAKLAVKCSEGLYVVGSGSTGAAEALATIGAAYFGIMMASALAIKKPHPTFVPEGWTPPVAATASNGGSTALAPNLTVDEVMRTKQFYLLGTSFTAVAMGGFALFSVAKPMMNEVFTATMPHIVTSAFAAKFILIVSAGSLAGRIIWAAVSDRIGRKATFLIFSMGSLPLWLSLPTFVDQVITTHEALPLYSFIAASTMLMSFVGGHYAILPAWEADLFGSNHVAAVHGRMLIFSSTAALVGPAALIKLRYISEKRAILDLLEKISPDAFQAKFNAPVEQAVALLDSKVLSISKLMVLAPPGTIDPTPYIYDSTMYGLSGLMVCAIAANLATFPLKPKPTITIEATEVTSNVKKLH